MLGHRRRPSNPHHEASRHEDPSDPLILCPELGLLNVRFEYYGSLIIIFMLYS